MSEVSLFDKIESRSATVGVIGLGYVGLPLCSNFHRAGFSVIGFDVDPKKIKALAAGTSYLGDLHQEAFATLSASDRFDATDEMSRLAEVDAVAVCVPTPLGAHKEPVLDYVVQTGRVIGEHLHGEMIVVLESTTYPGTTRDEFRAAIAQGIGERLDAPMPHLAYSPEREDPGRVDVTSDRIPKLVGGLGPDAAKIAVELYGSAFESVIPVSSPEIAESSKLLENIFRAVNIALVNEMKVVLTDLGIDVWEVIDAASTKPFGFMRFEPGPGLGGHCIPIDPFYMVWKADEVNRNLGFIEHAGSVNTAMPRYVYSRLQEALNDRSKPVRSSRVLVLGLAYKPNVADPRESPTFELIELLRDGGADVEYHDPYIASSPAGRDYDLQMESVSIDPEQLARYDCVLISTAHESVDYEMIAQHAPLVVDTRNVMAPHEAVLGDRLVKA